MEVTIKKVPMQIYIIDRESLEGEKVNISEDEWLVNQQIMIVFMDQQKKLERVYNDS